MIKERENYDLIIVGGGLTASFLCLSIFKINPTFKILIIEKGDKFPNKTGESVVDLTAILIKSLNIGHLLKKHTVKTGVRFLFNESNSSNISDVSEFASPTFPGMITAYHLNRSLFDQQLLDEVISKGATVLRPAEISNASYLEFNNEIDVLVSGELRNYQSKWVVDATGRARYLSKQLNWKDKSISLNTGAIMAHFTNIAPDKKWDTPENNFWDTKSVGLRKFSTTHLMRKNSWWWIIRLNETTTSIGVVFDKNKVQFDDYKSYFVTAISKDAQLSIITKEAEMSAIKNVAHVPYVSEKLYSKGVALIGDSGAFIDPLISPGIEMSGQQSIWLAELLTQEKRTGKFDESAWKKYSNIFYKAYDSRLRIYTNAYNIIESKDLFSVWLMQGNYFYFSWVVYPAILFERKLKVPLHFNSIERAVLKYFENRFNIIQHKRVVENRISETKPNAITYSGVRVPRNILFLFMPAYLLIKSTWAYIKLEVKELFTSH